jgi:ssRNA-specific RNase YbeY (16S rRNA maturation enzyme)
MTYQIDIENNSQSKTIPSIEKCEVWIAAVLNNQQIDEAEVSIYIRN